jgi:hypothetical protein
MGCNQAQQDIDTQETYHDLEFQVICTAKAQGGMLKLSMDSKTFTSRRGNSIYWQSDHILTQELDANSAVSAYFLLEARALIPAASSSFVGPFTSNLHTCRPPTISSCNSQHRPSLHETQHIVSEQMKQLTRSRSTPARSMTSRVIVTFTGSQVLLPALSPSKLEYLLAVRSTDEFGLSCIQICCLSLLPDVL